MEQKNGRRPKKENNFEDQYQNRKERVVVSSPNEHQNLTSTLDFEWPEYISEKQRIKANTLRYANVPIPEIFGVKVPVEDLDSYNVFRELKTGDVIDVVVTSIDDNNVTFKTVATKQVIQSSVNLKKYNKLKCAVPFNATAVVTRANRELVYVDIIKPVYEKWLHEVLTDLDQQRNMTDPKIVKVHNLQLTRGGFIGQANIPAVSEYVGQDYTVEAFIPGSQIVLNIEENFDQWNGKTVDTFITNYMFKPGSKTEMSLVCSRKEYLKFLGDVYTINMFRAYCEDGDEWKITSKIAFDGKVTGIINSSKKCGVFVEIPELFITGMVEMDANQLVNYKPNTPVKVRINGFEENTWYDAATGQMRHDAPYEIEDSILRSCDVKPILKFA